MTREHGKPYAQNGRKANNNAQNMNFTHSNWNVQGMAKPPPRTTSAPPSNATNSSAFIPHKHNIPTMPPYPPQLQMSRGYGPPFQGYIYSGQPLVPQVPSKILVKKPERKKVTITYDDDTAVIEEEIFDKKVEVKKAEVKKAEVKKAEVKNDPTPDVHIPEKKTVPVVEKQISKTIPAVKKGEVSSPIETKDVPVSKPKPSSFNISVKTKKKDLTLSVTEKDTISSLQKKINSSEGDSLKGKLSFEGEELVGERTISSYKIVEGSIITLDDSKSKSEGNKKSEIPQKVESQKDTKPTKVRDEKQAVQRSDSPKINQEEVTKTKIEDDSKKTTSGKYVVPVALPPVEPKQTIKVDSPPSNSPKETIRYSVEELLAFKPKVNLPHPSIPHFIKKSSTNTSNRTEHRQKRNGKDRSSRHPSKKRKPKITHVSSANAWKGIEDTAKGDKTEKLKLDIQLLLNQVTPEKLRKIVTKFSHLEGLKKLPIDEVVKLIYDKAVSEPNFANVYAEFCTSTSEVYEKFLPEHLQRSKELDIRKKKDNKMALSQKEKDILKNNFSEEEKKLKNKYNFTRALLNLCQKKFEEFRALAAEAETKDILEIVESRLTDEQKKKLEEMSEQERAMYLEEQKHKFNMRRKGIILFLAELFKKKLLGERIIHEIIKTLLLKKTSQKKLPDMKPGDIELVTSLLESVGKQLDHPDCKKYIDYYFTVLEVQRNRSDLPSRYKFLLMNIIESRNRGWQRLIKKIEAKKISDVHKEHEREQYEKNKKAREMRKHRSWDRKRDHDYKSNKRSHHRRPETNTNTFGELAETKPVKSKEKSKYADPTAYRERVIYHVESFFESPDEDPIPDIQSELNIPTMIPHLLSVLISLATQPKISEDHRQQIDTVWKKLEEIKFFSDEDVSKGYQLFVKRVFKETMFIDQSNIFELSTQFLIKFLEAEKILELATPSFLESKNSLPNDPGFLISLLSKLKNFSDLNPFIFFRTDKALMFKRSLQALKEYHNIFPGIAAAHAIMYNEGSIPDIDQKSAAQAALGIIVGVELVTRQDPEKEKEKYTVFKEKLQKSYQLDPKNFDKLLTQYCERLGDTSLKRLKDLFQELGVYSG